MQNQVLFFILLSGMALLCAGCTESIPVVPPGSPPDSMTPGPTVTMPPGQSVTVQINEKDPIKATIKVIFAGGEGQIATRDILVRLTRPDGEVIIEHLTAEMQDEVEIQGTKESDRIEVYVTLNTGKTYKIIDQLVPYRTRG
ncbi:MAG: hypothetical protein BWY93_01596 [Euryarchaeota archaeon ADurb.BinA087]|nr:MAG: hypothetical protein BWY93_01596 [Euryarchaeota archaeon ADurb.BinA087]